MKAFCQIQAAKKWQITNVLSNRVLFITANRARRVTKIPAETVHHVTTLNQESLMFTRMNRAIHATGLRLVAVTSAVITEENVQKRSQVNGCVVVIMQVCKRNVES
jgi:hypothetical protein